MNFHAKRLIILMFSLDNEKEISEISKTFRGVLQIFPF